MNQEESVQQAQVQLPLIFRRPPLVSVPPHAPHMHVTAVHSVPPPPPPQACDLLDVQEGTRALVVTYRVVRTGEVISTYIPFREILKASCSDTQLVIATERSHLPLDFGRLEFGRIQALKTLKFLAGVGDSRASKRGYQGRNYDPYYHSRSHATGTRGYQGRNYDPDFRSRDRERLCRERRHVPNYKTGRHVGHAPLLPDLFAAFAHGYDMCKVGSTGRYFGGRGQ